MALPSGGALTGRECLEDLTEFTSFEGEEMPMFGGIKGQLTGPCGREDIVIASGEYQPSAVGGVGDEDIRVHEVVAIFHDDELLSSNHNE